MDTTFTAGVIDSFRVAIVVWICSSVFNLEYLSQIVRLPFLCLDSHAILQVG